MSEPLFDRLAIIGTGLIGSSIARAARAQGAVRTIVATSHSSQTRKRIKELGIADEVAETNAEAVKGGDLVVVCVPVGVCGDGVEPGAGHGAEDIPPQQGAQGLEFQDVRARVFHALGLLVLLESGSVRRMRPGWETRSNNSIFGVPRMLFQ